MKAQTLNVVYGCLLHDIGKAVYRSGLESGNHSLAGVKWLENHNINEKDILDSVKYHHARELNNADIDIYSPAYITYIADNISAAADRREIEEDGNPHFDKNLLLSPIFTHMNGEHSGYNLDLSELDGKLRMPEKKQGKANSIEYEALLNKIGTELSNIPLTEEWINSLLGVLEAFTSKMPSSTFTGESADISLYNHLKTTAAIGTCISEYLISENITDYKTYLFDNENEFRKKNAFILFSADFSGIQKFIYTVSTKNALKSLRSRSFFLELTMEHFIDELLGACGICRANLLYSGGGHCYILLPNTESTKTVVNNWCLRFNDWLTDNFGTSLYLGTGFTECSANDLMNYPNEEEPYKAMFRRVSQSISKKKMSRYSASQIIFLNKQLNNDEGRECRVCGRVDKLIKDDDEDTYSCSWCHTFEKISEKIQKYNVYCVTKDSRNVADFILPSCDDYAQYFITDESHARKMLSSDEEIIRIYTKNEAYAGLKYSTRLHVGDYAYSNIMEELSEKSSGIKRLAVCRMDVDDLGQAFIAGFENKNAKNASEKNHFVTISRTAQFSSEMSLFFKKYINSLLDGTFRNKNKLHVSIVYSGGDDVFLVGAWTDVILAARQIRSAFVEYTCGALSISGGIGIFDDHYPIRLAASETADLEDSSKKLPNKDAISLFEPDTHTYTWTEFNTDVLGEKYKVVADFFDGQEERGNSFLYKLVDLLREANIPENNRLPLARFAYILARLEPNKNSKYYENYKVFKDKMYMWALNKEERKKVLTAIYIYVYQNREVKK